MWREELQQTSVVVQWDPDHTPSGSRATRRSIQLGLLGDILKRYTREWIVGIEDISDFVREQQRYAQTGNFDQLMTPREEMYPVTETVAR